MVAAKGYQEHIWQPIQHYPLYQQWKKLSDPEMYLQKCCHYDNENSHPRRDNKEDLEYTYVQPV